MKKTLAIIILLIAASAVIYGLSFVYLLIALALFDSGGVLIDIAVTLAAGIGVDRLRRLYRRKYGLKAPLFFVCAYLPSIVGSAVYFAVYNYLDGIGYFEGFFAGLGEFVLGLSWIATAAAFTAAGGLYLLISFIIEKKRRGTGNTPPEQTLNDQ